MFSSRFARVVALCGALANIEYSNVARADKLTEATPMATPTPMSTATPVPLRKPVIDAQAQRVLRQMAAAYAKLNSFSCVVNVNATAGKETEEIRASIAWQKPNRFNILMSFDTIAVRSISNGRTMWQRASTSPNKYGKSEISSENNSLPSALRTANASALLLSNLNFFVPGSQKSPWQITSARLLPSDIAGVDVVAVVIQVGSKSSDLQLSIDRKSQLLRQIKLNGMKGDTSVTLTETYSNVRLNPALPASTFAFKPRPSDELSVPTKAELQSFDPRLKVGARPLTFAAKDLNGNAISPAKYKGRVLLLDFWATWCGPCVDELPAIKAAYDKYHAQGFDIVGISFDADKKQLTDFLQQRKMAWPQVFDGKGWESAIGKTYGVRSIPFTVLVGRDGKIAALNLRGAALEVAVKAALAKQ